ncbi:MAG: hypothetical protein GXP13_01260 [Gammaproteobacteria bacterium]|nr:hypothetical protein [Gammaproteobacteria bacterium]
MSNSDNKVLDEQKTKIGIVLSSGGARGVYAHTGFVQALQQMNIHINAVTGCSAGAVVGGILASGKNMQSWAAALTTLKPGQFWQPSWFRLISSLILKKWKGYTGLSSMDAAKDFCTSQLKVKTYEECEIPFSALAINIGTGKKKLFNSGELAPTMVASAAIPMIYQPVKIDGQYYCDGALVDLAPTDAICCKYNLDILIIHHVAQSYEDETGLQNAIRQPWTLLEILNRYIFRQSPWYYSDKHISFKNCPCGCDSIVIIINPDLPELRWPLTNSGFQVLQAALKQTIKYLEPYQESITHDPESLGMKDRPLASRDIQAQKDTCQ